MKKQLFIVLLLTVTMSFMCSQSQASTIYGTIFNNNIHINNALVVLLFNNNIIDKTITDNNGYYSINANNGDYILAVAKSGYMANINNVTINGDNIYNIELKQISKNEFKQRGRIIGFMQNNNEKPIDFSMVLLKQNQQIVGITEPRQKFAGIYELEWYLPGNYTVEGIAKGCLPQIYYNQNIIAGESLWLNIIME